jgi:parallel beta-helix repeat protein
MRNDFGADHYLSPKFVSISLGSTSEILRPRLPSETSGTSSKQGSKRDIYPASSLISEKGKVSGQTIQRLLLVFLLVIATPFLFIPKSLAVDAYKATQTIYITNTEVIPSEAPITPNGNTYTLYNHITSSLLNTIVIQRNNIILDGAGFTLEGNLSLTGSTGINLTQTNNVTIQNLTIRSFHNGIFLKSSTNNHITEANISSNKYGIYLQSSNLNQITGNNLTQNTLAGIWLDISQNNNIAKNKLANTISSNFGGIVLHDLSNNNNILDNYIASNTRYGVYIENCWSNRIYHNNFVDNFYEAFIDPGTSNTNTWDIGYPSGGNYWSDYGWLDTKNGPNQNQQGSDGIGDSFYAIDGSNRDRYPLKNSWIPTWTNITVNTTQKPVIILSNTTITDIISTSSTLKFSAAGPNGQTGYALITFPNVNNTAIQIRIKGNPPTSPFPVINTNGTQWFIYFEFHLSTQPISIIYNTPQLPIPIAPGGVITMMLAMIMTLVGFSKFRRHRKQSTVSTE